MKQRGFITTQITAWIAVAAAVAFLATGIALKVQTERLATKAQQFEAFKAQVTAAGKAAELQAKAKTQADQANQEKTDHENATLRRDVAALAGRLRESRASSGILPAPSPGAPSPDRITFDRTQLERTLQQLDAGVSGLIAEGDAAVTDLNSAKSWVKNR